MEESNNARKVSFSDDRSAKRQKSSEIDDQVGAAAVTEANGTIVAPRLMRQSTDQMISEMLTSGAFDAPESGKDPTSRQSRQRFPNPRRGPYSTDPYANSEPPLERVPATVLPPRRLPALPPKGISRSHSLMVPTKAGLQRLDSAVSQAGINTDFPDGFSWEREDGDSPLPEGPNVTEDGKRVLIDMSITGNGKAVAVPLSGKLAAEAASNNITFDDDGKMVHHRPDGRNGVQNGDDEGAGGDDDNDDDDNNDNNNQEVEANASCDGENDEQEEAADVSDNEEEDGRVATKRIPTHTMRQG